MKPEISEHYLFLETAHQICDSLSQAYFKIGHTAKDYELRQRIAHFKQGDQPLALYYSSLWKLRKELEHYTTATYKKHVEEIQVSEFLAGLNSNYKQVRVQIQNMALPLNFE